MVFFSKAKKGALRREATKRKCEDPVCGTVAESVKSNSETESDGEFDDILDAISLTSESDSEYSCDSIGSFENACCGFCYTGIEENENERLEDYKNSSMLSSGNVWETFNAATASELRNISMISSDVDNFELFDDTSKLAGDVEYAKVTEGVDEMLPNRPLVEETFEDEGQGM